MTRDANLSWIILGQSCYVGRDYKKGLWETTPNHCRVHYFTTEREARSTLRGIGRLAGMLGLYVKRVCPGHPDN